MFPASVPVHAAAALTVTVAASVTSQIRIQGLYRATKSPELTPFSRNVSHTAGDRTSQTTTIASNVQGDVVALSVDAVTAGIKRGTVYVVVQLASYAVTLTVARGYVVEGVPLVLGQFIEPGPGGGEGNIRTVTGTNPAAAAEISEAVPTNAMWKLLSFSAVLVQGITQTPTPQLVIDDGTTANRIQFHDGSQQGASTTRNHLWIAGSESLGAGARTLVDTDTVQYHALSSLADHLPLSEGYRIRTVTAGIGANTDYAAPIFFVEEWLAPP